MMTSSIQHRWFVFSIFTILFSALTSEGQLVDVRLANGPTIYEGTVEYTTDNATWQTTCGVVFDFIEAKLICEHIGAHGTNMAITDSHFGSDLDPPTTFLNCQTIYTSISECEVVSECSMYDSARVPAAAVCYDETYIGCYIDSVDDPVLPGDPLVASASMTIDKCITHCRESIIADYVYAGVEFGSECYCGGAGTNYSRLGRATNGDRDCLTQCPGNSKSSCGGSGHIAVFYVSVPTTPPSTTSTPTVTSSTPTTDPTEGGTVSYTSVTSELSTGSTTTAEIDTATGYSCPKCTDTCPQCSNSPSIGLGVLVFLLLVYGVLSTAYSIGIRRSLREKQLQQGNINTKGKTELSHQLSPITSESEHAFYQEIPTEGESNPKTTATQSEAITHHQLYVSPEQVEQRWKEQEATPPGVHGKVPAHYERVMKK